MKSLQKQTLCCTFQFNHSGAMMKLRKYFTATAGSFITSQTFGLTFLPYCALIPHCKVLVHNPGLTNRNEVREIVSV